MRALRSICQSVVARLGKRSRRRRSVSRGQALVEFALFVPLMMTLVVGATDISTLLDDHLNVVYASRAGARVGSVIGNYSPPSPGQYTADCAIIGAVQSALASTRNVQITQIAIYQAGTTGVYSAGLPQDIYAGNAVCNADGTVTPPASQATWPPIVRSNTPFFEDSIGVAITYNYSYDFNLLNIPTPTVTDWAVMPIEIVVNPTVPTPAPTTAP